jgi:hypothetical protein
MHAVDSQLHALYNNTVLYQDRIDPQAICTRYYIRKISLLGMQPRRHAGRAVQIVVMIGCYDGMSLINTICMQETNYKYSTVARAVL